MQFFINVQFFFINNTSLEMLRELAEDVFM